MPWPLSGIGSEVFHLPALVKPYQTVGEKEGLEGGMGRGLELKGGKGKGDIREPRLLGLNGER